MASSQGVGACELLDNALQPAQVLQRIDHVICLFLSDLTAGSLSLLELVRVPRTNTTCAACLASRHAMLSHASVAEVTSLRPACRCCPSAAGDLKVRLQRDLLLLWPETNITRVIRCRARQAAARLVIRGCSYTEHSRRVTCTCPAPPAERRWASPSAHSRLSTGSRPHRATRRCSICLRPRLQNP